MGVSVKQVSSIVKDILINEPRTRDDDNLLVLKVWAKKNPDLRNPSFSFVKFSEGMLDGTYPSYESISRARRKLQEEFPNLRGLNYKERHKHQEVIKDELNDPQLKRGGTP